MDSLSLERIAITSALPAASATNAGCFIRRQITIGGVLVGQILFSDGAKWWPVAQNPYDIVEAVSPVRMLNATEEFLGYSLSTSFLTNFVVGTATFAALGTVDDQTITGLWSGTSTTNVGDAFGANTVLNIVRFDGFSIIECAAKFRLPSLSSNGIGVNYTLRLGFMDSLAGDPTDGIYLRYNHAVNSGKFQFVSRVNGVETATDSGITAVANTFYTIRIVVEGDGASSYSYSSFINGVAAGPGGSSSVVPKGAGRQTGMAFSVITNSAAISQNTFQIDFYSVRGAYFAAR